MSGASWKPGQWLYDLSPRDGVRSVEFVAPAGRFYSTVRLCWNGRTVTLENERLSLDARGRRPRLARLIA